mgnify:CR=1 FL=1
MSSKIKISLAWQMMIGLALGIVVGALVDSSFAQTWLQPLGDLFIRLIRMVVVPLVLATIIAGAAGISDTSKLGRVAVKVLLVYAVTTGIAVACGLLFAGIIQPGMGLDLSTEGLQAKEVVAPPLVKTLLAIVPINPMQAMAEGSMLQIIFFAVIFGFALSGLGERGKPVLHFFEIVGDVMIRVTHMVMLYAPIGVFGLISFTVSRHGLAVLLPLGALILTAFLATVVFVGMILLPLVRIATGIPIMTFLKGIFEPWLVAFTTCSSAAALPANLNAARKLGSTKAISSFSIPLGNTINMNGTAIMQVVATLFVAGCAGYDVTFGQLVVVALLVLIASVGTPAAPGAGAIILFTILSGLGYVNDSALLAYSLILAINRPIEMLLTALNVVGDSAASIYVAKSEGMLDETKYNA